MTSSHSFDTYFYWSVGPPLVASGIMVLVIAVFVIFFLIQFVIHTCKCNLGSICTCRCNQYFVDPFFYFVKVIFRKHIKKMEDSQNFTLYRYEISPWQIIMLSTITLMVVSQTVMSFWVSFIANETFVCDPQLDCFLRDPSTQIVFSSKPLDNCTSYDSTNGTVVCFQFVFDLTEGFSSAVGFMGVSVIYCRLYTLVLIWLREFGERQVFTNTRFKEVFIMLVSLIIHIMTAVIAIYIIIAVNTISFLSDVVFKTNKSIFIFYAYFFSFAYIGPLAGFYIAFVLRKARKVATSKVTSEEENHLLGASIDRSNYTNIQDT